MEEPQGGLTLVFTDIEGSTALVRELGGSYGLVLRVHQAMLARCFEAHRGRQMGTEGDSVFFAFPTAADAVAGAVEAQLKIEHHPWPDAARVRVRMGIHSGPVTISGGEYVGLTVHEVSRICAVAHGGQILCSAAVASALGEGSLRDLGAFVLRGLPGGSRLFQVCASGLEDDFPSPRDTIRDGGARVSIWLREPASPPRPAPPVSDAICFRTIAGEPLGDDLAVEIRPAAHGPSEAFRLVVRQSGTIEEEYDGVTVGGAIDIAKVVNAHSRLIRVEARSASPAPDGPSRS
jgi:class 3 adenylate cyclase